MLGSLGHVIHRDNREMDMEGELVLKEVHFPLAKDCLVSLQLVHLGPCCSSAFLLFPGSGWSFLAYYLGAGAHFVPLALTTAAVEEETGLVCKSYQEREQIWPTSPSFLFTSHHLIVCTTLEQAECS